MPVRATDREQRTSTEVRVKIVDVRQTTVPIASTLQNAYIDFRRRRRGRRSRLIAAGQHWRQHSEHHCNAGRLRTKAGHVETSRPY